MKHLAAVGFLTEIRVEIGRTTTVQWARGPIFDRHNRGAVDVMWTSSGFPNVSLISVSTSQPITLSRVHLWLWRIFRRASNVDDLSFSSISTAICGLGLLIFALSPAPAAAQVEVDLELVFASDGSGSIDDDELRFQRQGYAAALADPRVQDAIAAGPLGRIAVAFVEWGAPTSQHTIVDWTVIAGPEDAVAWGERLVAAPRAAYGYNSISEAIAYSADLIRTNDIESARKVIDLSGDGPQIGGRSLDLIRNLTVADGITINGLVVANRNVRTGPSGEPLDEHYRMDVIGGFGAFVVVATEERGFTQTVLAKMVREIADSRPTGAPTELAQDDPHER